MRGQPLADFGMLVGRVIVDDRMSCLASWNLGFDGIEKADELLMPMTLHVAPDHRAVKNVEGGEERRRSVPDVIMGHCALAALLQRQPRLRAVERLDLALFVNRQHNGV